MGEKRMHSKLSSKTLKNREHLEAVDINGGILFKSDGRVLSGFAWLKLGTSGELL
jgi:hypothetical protein